MARKAKFKPEITRVKLNPEQAVLTCSCYCVPMNQIQSGTHRNAHIDVPVFSCDNYFVREGATLPICSLTGGAGDAIALAHTQGAS